MNDIPEPNLPEWDQARCYPSLPGLYPEVQLTISERDLSDKSKVYSVLIKREGMCVELECIDQKRAIYLHKIIGDAIDENTIYATR